MFVTQIQPNYIHVIEIVDIKQKDFFFLHCLFTEYNKRPNDWPAHDKTNKITCAPSKDSDQPAHPPGLISLQYPYEESVDH